MMKVAVLLLLVVAVAQTQLSSEPVCNENETYMTCRPACEPSCYIQRPILCAFPCVSGCFCNKGYVRNSSNDCVRVEQCEEVTEHSGVCKNNETFRICGPACEPSCDVPSPKCPKYCKPGCFCQEGFVRKRDDECVSTDQCRAPH